MDGRLARRVRPFKRVWVLCIMPVRLTNRPMGDAARTRFVSPLAPTARPRGGGGCPWDREQTRASLKPYLIEEAYEVVQAIEEESRDHLVEELGDLLFPAVFHRPLRAAARGCENG